MAAPPKLDSLRSNHDSFVDFIQQFSPASPPVRAHRASEPDWYKGIARVSLIAPIQFEARWKVRSHAAPIPQHPCGFSI
jgi:hypothetical protein